MAFAAVIVLMLFRDREEGYRLWLAQHVAKGNLRCSIGVLDTTKLVEGL